MSALQNKFLRASLAGLAWTLVQLSLFLLCFEIGRRAPVFAQYWDAADLERPLYWQYYFFLFAALLFAANQWIEHKRIHREPSRRFGIWLGLALILAFFSRVHLTTRPSAVGVMAVATIAALLLREIGFARSRKRGRI